MRQMKRVGIFKILSSIKALICFEMILVILLTLMVGIGQFLFPEVPFPPPKVSSASSLSRIFTSDPDTPEAESEQADPFYQASIFDTIPDGSFAIVTENIPYKSKGEVFIKNETSYSPKIDLLASKSLPVLSQSDASLPENAPIVLIIHTHGTEAYSDNGFYYFQEDELARSDNTEENVVAVGAVLSQALEDSGIPTLHVKKMHDKESYLTSYNESAKTVIECLSEHPSIELVIDLHRDAIIYEDGRMVRTLSADGTAQLMLLVGSDQNGANYPHWKDNLEMALELQVSLEAISPGITRPIDLRASSFNQQLSEKALLLEVGSCGNTLDEAKQAAAIFAQALSSYIKGQ